MCFIIIIVVIIDIIIVAIIDIIIVAIIDIIIVAIIDNFTMLLFYSQNCNFLFANEASSLKHMKLSGMRRSN